MTTPELRNRSLLVAYALPYFLYVGIASVPGLSRELDYALRIVAAGAALAWAWRRFLPLRNGGSAAASVGIGVAAGIAGTVLWVALKAPFAPEGGESWSPAAFALRLTASATVVALFEELLFRGFLLRAVVQWEEERRREPQGALDRVLERSVNAVPARRGTWLAVGLSSAAFALGHAVAEYPAALAYGLLMAGVALRRDLLACIVAHGVTNAALACYVRATGQWALW